MLLVPDKKSRSVSETALWEASAESAKKNTEERIHNQAERTLP
jgi:hypothetical protein